MNQRQQTSQTQQPNGPSYQPGQQGDRGEGVTGVDGGSKGQKAQSQSREVSSGAPRDGQVSSAQSAGAVMPAVDIFEDETGFTLIADMPGVSKEKLNVRVTGDSLVVEGEASMPDIGNMELVYGEAHTPQYRRSFTLSRELDPGKIEAKLANGVLRLRIPKAEEAKPRRIDVSVG